MVNMEMINNINGTGPQVKKAFSFSLLNLPIQRLGSLWTCSASEHDIFKAECQSFCGFILA